jgi:hypothetical protein
MSKCKDVKVGNLLLAYELGGLTEEDNERFEAHLIECEYCFGELKAFEQEAEVLRGDEDVRQMLSTAGEEQHSQEPNFLQRLWRYLWPETPILYRPALVYLVLLILLIPAYRGIMGPGEDKIRNIQTMHLLPDRSADDNVFRIGTEDDGLVSFVFRGALPGRIYTLTLESEDGRAVFRDEKFGGFDEYETGRLLLQLGGMEEGNYRLIIVDPLGEAPLNRQEHSFKIEK